MKPNKNIMVGILLAEKALLKSPYVKRYVSIKSVSLNYISWFCNKSPRLKTTSFDSHILLSIHKKVINFKGDLKWNISTTFWRVITTHL
ncbi:MAG: hypothetical protein ACI9CO_002266 [Candidatus Azotimanducaceae bacterium]|jgi:hypothetical protein